MTHAQTLCVAGSSTDNQLKKKRQVSFKAQLKEQPWRSHQPVSMRVKQGSYCMYKCCPGCKGGQQVKRQHRGYRIKSRCEECSIMTGEDVWLCNNTKKSVEHINHTIVISNIIRGTSTSYVLVLLYLPLLKPPLLLPQNLP